MKAPREPTSEECATNAEVDGGRACWYPSMGGYVGHAVAIEQKRDDGYVGCWDIYVWHDGEFPFAGEGEYGRSPTLIHHCDPTDFIRFGRLIESFGETS